MHLKRSTLAGSWYAEGAGPLREQVETLLEDVQPGVALGPLTAVLVPHAGYVYSGHAAAAGYGCLRGTSYRRAVILAPSHFASFRGAALLDADAFETPLGTVAVDREAVDALRAAAPLFYCDPAPYQREHSLEIQLPFLQCVVPAIAVVPVLLGGLVGDDYDRVAGALAALRDDGTLFVVSSDFVHYGRRFDYLPFVPAGPAQVREGLRTLDMGAIELVCAGDGAGFQRYVADTGATICGRVPIVVFLTMHAARSRGRLIEYYASLDVTQDYEHCVSYASIAFPRAG